MLDGTVPAQDGTDGGGVGDASGNSDRGTRDETKVRRSARIGKVMSINTVGSPGRWHQRHAWIGVSRETPPFHLAEVGSNCRIALATQPAKRLIDPDSSDPFQNHSHTPTNSNYVRGTNYATTALSFTYGPRREPNTVIVTHTPLSSPSLTT